jgi:hypothetical protein
MDQFVSINGRLTKMITLVVIIRKVCLTYSPVTIGTTSLFTLSIEHFTSLVWLPRIGVRLNQVMGPTHSGWRNDTLNHKDNGCQFSPSGPDRFHPSCPMLSLFPISPQKPLHFVGDDYFYMKDGVFHQLNNNKNSFKNSYESAISFLNLGAVSLSVTIERWILDMH